MITIQEVNPSNRKLVNNFIQLPFRIYANVPQWVPPLSLEARQVFNRDKFPYYQNNDAIFLLASDPAGQIVGRLAVLNPQQFNEYQDQKTAFFYLFECENDLEAANSLFNTGIDWARQQGLDRISGPRGFTVFDGKGLLVRGFDHRPAFGLPYNLDYYPNLLESCGFTTSGELLSGYLDVELQFPQKIHQVADLLKQRRGFTITRYQSRRDLQMLITSLKDLYNNSLGGTQENVPITDGEAKALAKQMLWFANPKLIKIIMKDGKPVGFLFAYPDISEALIKTKGKIFPFGWWYLYRELQKTKWININGAGMIEKYRGLGGTALLFSEMYKSVAEEGYLYADIVQISVDNDKMLRELRDLGIDFYKTHRVYEKAIDSHA